MKSHYCVMTLAAASMALSSCATMGNFDSVEPGQANVASQSLPATVVAAQNTTIKAEASTRNVGTGIGAAAGLAGGQLLGGGSGRVASTIGFAAAGALAGRYIADRAGRTKAQRLTVRIDGSQTMYTVVQPIYEQFGAIPVGTHGIFQLGGNSQFIPDGQGAYGNYGTPY